MYISKKKSIEDLKNEEFDFSASKVVISPEVYQYETGEKVNVFQVSVWEPSYRQLRNVGSTSEIRTARDLATRYDDPSLLDEGYQIIKSDSHGHYLVLYYGQYEVDSENVPHIGSIMNQAGISLADSVSQLGDTGIYARIGIRSNFLPDLIISDEEEKKHLKHAIGEQLDREERTLIEKGHPEGYLEEVKKSSEVLKRIDQRIHLD